MPGLLAACCLLALTPLLAAPEFTPPGPNIALGKPCTMDPLPNHGDCAAEGHRTATD